MHQKAFFLDRDGTLNIDTDYVHRIEEWQWIEGSIEAIRWMNAHAYKVIVVTNQSGVARGKFTLEQVQELHNWVDKQLVAHNARIDAWYVAPHHPAFHAHLPQEWLHDRKPSTGMFEKAAARFGIDYPSSKMVGDKISDLKPARSLGMESFLVESRFTPEQDTSWLSRHSIPVFPTLWDVITHLEQTRHDSYNH